MRNTFTSIVAFGSLVLFPGLANAQLSGLNDAATIRTNQSLVGASAGTGVTQGKSVADVSSNGRPAIGVGVGSGKVDHFGSAGSVSVANNARLLGIDGAGGPNSPNSVSIRNPSQKPILSSAPTAGKIAK